MRVLMLAYSCMPGVGSEPEAGFNYLRAAAEHHDVVVLTHSVYAEALHDAVADGLLPAVTIVAVDTPRMVRARLGAPGLGHVDYLLWQFRAWRLLRRGSWPDVDVVHHVTYGADWMPCAALAMRSLPVVWGSVGGAAPVPWRLARFLTMSNITAELCREAVTRALRRWPRRQVRRHPRCLLVAKNKETAAAFADLGVRTVIDPHVVALPHPPEELPSDVIDPHRALFVSKLAGWKGILLAVSALALLEDWHLDVYGTGALLPVAEREAARLGVRERITFHGRVPKSDVLDAMRRAQVLLFPSMHDTSPMPVAEAGWAGCPVVCLDVCGPPALISGTTGVAVRPDRHAASGLAAAVRTVRRHRPVGHWSHERLTSSVDAWYDEVTRATT